MNIEVSEVPCNLRMEIYDVQADSFYQTKKCDVSENFWKLISKEHFPKLLKYHCCLAVHMCVKVFFLLLNKLNQKQEIALKMLHWNQA